MLSLRAYVRVGFCPVGLCPGGLLPGWACVTQPHIAPAATPHVGKSAHMQRSSSVEQELRPF